MKVPSVWKAQTVVFPVPYCGSTRFSSVTTMLPASRNDGSDARDGTNVSGEGRDGNDGNDGRDGRDGSNHARTAHTFFWFVSDAKRGWSRPCRKARGSKTQAGGSAWAGRRGGGVRQVGVAPAAFFIPPPPR